MHTAGSCTRTAIYYRETALARTGVVPVKDSWQIVTSLEVWAFEPAPVR